MDVGKIELDVNQEFCISNDYTCGGISFFLSESIENGVSINIIYAVD